MTAELCCIHCKKLYRPAQAASRHRAPGICPSCLLHHYGLSPEQLNALTHPILPPVKEHTYYQPSLPLRPTKIG